MEAGKPITDRLAAWAAGDRQALDEVMLLVYTELYQAARRVMSRELALPGVCGHLT